MKRAAVTFRKRAASHGGYVYHYSTDFRERWGEGRATPDQIWVQPPGTPTVGMAFLEAYRATADRVYLDAARDAAEALVYGQLESGGWTNSIDFDPGGQVAQYRNGRGRGRNVSSLDDGQTQSAIRLLVRVDRELEQRHEEIHRAARIAVDALLAAQFPNGGFPQVWREPVAARPAPQAAAYPTYDWRTEGRVKNYWDMYTLNDNVTGYVAAALTDAYRAYGDERCLQALHRLGRFLVLAQMPDPQPGWAQQYSWDMVPIWARKFEPPAIAGDESQEAVDTLMTLCAITGDRTLLEPIPRALAYLRRSLLPDGSLARYYELKTNAPLYMRRRGDVYTLTYSDEDLPSHYAWKIDSRIPELTTRYEALQSGRHDDTTEGAPATEKAVRKIVDALDDDGLWVSVYSGERLVGQPRFDMGSRYVSSEVFSRNLETLSRFVTSQRTRK